MTSGLKIKQVADAAGLTAATLRYYEQIGLLPVATRTAGGYRTYDERTVDRLAFIARAKRLGCSLGEITGLIGAWEGDQCAPIQDRLRELVAAKVVATRDQIGELVTFVAELQQAAEALQRHRPDGACDAECGCVGDGGAPPIGEERDVSPTTRPAATVAPVIACALSDESRQGRIADWQALVAHVEHREPIDGGVRCAFGTAVPVAELMRLVAAERDCCPFFAFAITVDRRGVALEVRAPDDALAVVGSMFGALA